LVAQLVVKVLADLFEHRGVDFRKLDLPQLRLREAACCWDGGVRVVVVVVVAQ
jgi:hypothetical protein